MLSRPSTQTGRALEKVKNGLSLRLRATMGMAQQS